MSQRYFNFPVCLLDDFLTDTETTLDKIRDYALYSYALSEYGYAEYDTIGNALIYYGIDTDHPEHYLWRGKEVYETVFFHAPKVGIKNCIGFVPVHGLLHDLYKGY